MTLSDCAVRVQHSELSRARKTPFRHKIDPVLFAQFHLKYQVFELGYWYRKVLDYLKEKKECALDTEPIGLMERSQPWIRRLTNEVTTEACGKAYDGTGFVQELQCKINNTADELVQLSETSGFASGRHPTPVAVAAVSLSFIIGKDFIEDKAIRDSILALAKRDNLAARVNLGKEAARQREKEIRQHLCDTAQKCPWVKIPVTPETVVDVYVGIAPLLRISNASLHRQYVDNAKSMRDLVQTYGSPGDATKAPVATHKWTVRAPPVASSAPAAAPLHKSLINAPPQDSSLPTIRRKSAPQEPVPASPVFISPVPLLTSSVELVQSEEDEKAKISAEDIARQLFPPKSFPSFAHVSKIRKLRFYKIRDAITRLKDARIHTDSVPWDQWGRDLAHLHSEFELPIKPEPTNGEEQEERPKPRLKLVIGPRKRHRYTLDDDKKALDQDDSTIECLLVQGVQIQEILDHSGDLRSMLHSSPAALARLQMITAVEEAAPDGGLSEVSAFATEHDPDFQLRSLEEQRVVSRFAGSTALLDGPPAKRAKITEDDPNVNGAIVNPDAS